MNINFLDNILSAARSKTNESSPRAKTSSLPAERTYPHERERGKKLARRDIAKIEDLERVESLESRARMCTWAKSIFEFDVTAAAVARGSLSLSLSLSLSPSIRRDVES